MSYHEKAILSLCSLLLDFGKVERITCHQDGVTHESDTDHTVMLAVFGSALAFQLYPNLDIGLVAQFALVHDLVEVYAGDTPTLIDMTEDFMSEKKARETTALEKIAEEFWHTFPWIHTTIERYEKLDTKEARFIKVLDKILPKITVVLNGAKYLNDHRYITRFKAQKSYDAQRIQLQKMSSDMPEILEIWEYFVQEELSLIQS